MKFFSYLSLAAAVALTGCASDLTGPDPVPDNGNQKGGPGVYIGVNFKPSSIGGTRGYTDGENSSNNGTEEGSKVENNVNELIIVLARANDNGFIAASTVTKDNLRIATDKGENVYNAVAKVYTSYLTNYYSDKTYKPNDNGNREVNVFVFCNPTGELSKYLDDAQYGDTDWVNLGCEVIVDGQVTNGSVWSTTMGGQFLMSNRDIATREIPGDTIGWQDYNTSAKAFSLSGMNGEPGGDNSINNAGAGRGNVLVERAAARIDFRDGSPANTAANTYHVLHVRKDDGTNDEDNPIINVELQKMSLVNMSNQFYYLPRVSSDGMPTGAILCGPELPWFKNDKGEYLAESGNYVVDYDAGKYSLPLEKDFSTYFNYPFFNNDGTINNLFADGLDDRWSTVKISEVLGDSEKHPTDKWTGTETNPVTAGQYHVWRYLTENTVWAPISNQMNGNTTGVVFKGRMVGNTDLLEDATVEITDDMKNLIEAVNREDEEFGNSDTAPIIYTFGDDNANVYLTWEKVVEAAINTSFSYTYGANGVIIPDWNRTNTLYEAVFGTGGTDYEFTAPNGKSYKDTKALDPNSANSKWIAWHDAGHPGQNATSNKEFKAAATGARFTIYQRSQDLDQKWGYYCYYYYWIHHNDNGNDGVMAPMEMAVVRNNVYKLAVTKLGRLGHPRLTENDPEPPKPNTPDETSKVYLTVDTQVVPWVVRVKDIEFD